MAGWGMQLLFLINCAHCPLQRDKLHLKLIIPNLRWALCDIYIYSNTKAAKSAYCAVAAKSDQVRPSQGRPGEARAVGFWCKPKCKNMLPMLQFIYLFFFIFFVFFFCFCQAAFVVAWLSTKMYKQHEEEPIGRSGYVCTLFISHTYWPAGATVRTPPAPPMAPCSPFPASTSTRTASIARARARARRSQAASQQLACLVLSYVFQLRLATPCS